MCAEHSESEHLLDPGGNVHVTGALLKEKLNIYKINALKAPGLWVLPGLWVRSNTLQKCQGIAHPVGLVGRERGRVNRWIDVYDFL